MTERNFDSGRPARLAAGLPTAASLVAMALLAGCSLIPVPLMGMPMLSAIVSI